MDARRLLTPDIQIRYSWLRMKMTPPNDAFAAGMVHWSESELKLTHSLDRRQFSLLRPYLGRKLLEIGAGGGRITALVAEAGCHDELVAVEPSPHFLRLLQSGAGKAPKTTLMETDAEKLLPEYREHFDSVYSVQVLEHIEHYRQLLETTLELTRPGGNVFLLVPALPFLFSELDSQYPPLPAIRQEDGSRSGSRSHCGNHAYGIQ